MSGYAKYDDLGYKPTHGEVEIRGHEGEWSVPVSVKQGRAMERDGITVMWPYSSCPAWVAEIGLAGVWMAVHRVITWPSRI